MLENAQAATLQPLDITHINLRADVDTPGGIPRKGAALVSGSTYAQQTYALADRSGIWSPKHNKSIEFLHIPKTGGTSIEDWSKSHNVRWGMNREWSELLPADGTDAKFSSGFNMSSRFLEPRWTPLRCQPWHIPRREFVARGGFDPYAGSRTFCVVKHPFARAVSDFIYQSSIKTAPRNATKATTFDAQAVEKACNPATLNAFYQVRTMSSACCMLHASCLLACCLLMRTQCPHIRET